VSAKLRHELLGVAGRHETNPHQLAVCAQGTIGAAGYECFLPAWVLRQYRLDSHDYGNPLGKYGHDAELSSCLKGYEAV